LLASFAYAELGEEWVKKYAFSAGVDIAFSKGDFNGKKQIHSSDGEESIILPEFPFFLVYAFDFRALANASVVAINMGLGYPDYEHDLQCAAGTATANCPYSARYLRLGLEYQYHFFWPSDLRIGAGIGYAFSSMRFPKASMVNGGEWSYANFTGNGASALLSMNYYFSENFAAECALRYRLLHLNRVATDREPPNDVSKLGSALLQHVPELGLRFMFVF
jgi:hypothetical protein